jgi:hypothetical protein
MQDLRVTGIEDEMLLATGSDGTRYRIPIDEEMHSVLRRRSAPRSQQRVSPRDVQAHIRAGMSAAEVAELTGAPQEYIERFEGPVVAERRFVIDAALAVSVTTAVEADASGSTFGSVIGERLETLGAEGVEWLSRKDPEAGWIVRVSFTAAEVEHAAEWGFDPKRTTLSPLNDDATRLSVQGPAPDALIPRLRAVPSDSRTLDSTRFDSAAFTEAELRAREPSPFADAIPFGRPGGIADATAREDANQESSGNTADLLEALRRRRGERESAPREEPQETRVGHPSTGTIRVIDIPLDDFNDDSDGFATDDMQPGRREQTDPPAQQAPRSARKGRAAMPSWDDIVFGARSDDD